MAPCRRTCLIISVLSLVALSNAGPLGPLPNVTSSDVGLKEGSCVLGDVVYMEGDKFAGATPCERCACAAGGVQCTQERCEPRPGCKALHRPDHCCPTYQCECEQEGRVYGNGEKLVDPEDPCRVCYCQGGEVVCRRIACFLRDDCQPRLVKGRCCPEYDNCPLRGVTAIPGLVPSVSSVATGEDVAPSAVPTPPKENIKQEITIKEITPVSEIPVITDVKIKEVLPIPSLEVPEYPSSKSPLIPREAVPENSSTSAESSSKTEDPVVIELISPLPTDLASKPTETSAESKSSADLLPSKISLSTQDSINSDIYPSHIPTVIATLGVPALTPDNSPAASTTRVAIIEEDDTSLFDHNPAFPPIPDDLSVIGTHEDEIIHGQNIDGDHMTIVHEMENVVTTPPPTETPAPKEIPTTTTQDIGTSTTTTTKNLVEEITSTTTSRTTEASTESSTTSAPITTRIQTAKDSPMLNVRTAIPTEILDLPSSLPEDINGELDAAESVTAFEDEHVFTVTWTTTTTESPIKVEEKTASPTTSKDEIIPRSSETSSTSIDTTTQRITEAPELLTTKVPEELTTSSTSRSNIATEITSQTEFSSLPVETSDQNPHDSAESVMKERSPSTTEAPSTIRITTEKLTTRPEIATVSTTEKQFTEKIDTTEDVLNSFGSSESTSTTYSVELVKNSPTQTEKNAALIDSTGGKKTNILTDLINIVDDVASISDHTEAPEVVHRTTFSGFSADSEELIPINAGYKSKNSNFNLNSITEIPLKTKNQAPVVKQKVVEIEDDDTDSITDSPPPYDKVEPTTRRPIIDNVSDTMARNETEKKDIEIITQSYVPSINRNRPTKVVMKKSNEKPVSDVSTEGPALVPGVNAATESALVTETSTTTERAPVTQPTSTTGSALVTEASVGTERALVAEVNASTQAALAAETTAPPPPAAALDTTTPSL